MMRWAVKPDGRATVEPMMPFGNMAEDDLVAIISFLRSQPPVKNAVPANEWTTMGKVIRTIATTFKPRTEINPPMTAPPAGITRERGEYLARYVTNCVGCHTPRDQTSFEATGPEFSGGMENRETFIARFQKGGRQYATSLMPWEAFALMTNDDLGAIYEFLHSLPASPGPTGEPTFIKTN
jgi:mono/diheme cytochrome c family protein